MTNLGDQYEALPMRPDSPSPVIPFLMLRRRCDLFGDGCAAMKGLSVEIGAYNAVLWRTSAGTLFSGLLYLAATGHFGPIPRR